MVFLNPIKAPIHTFGTERAVYIKSKTRRVGKGTVAADFSNQFAKFVIKNIVNMKLG